MYLKATITIMQGQSSLKGQRASAYPLMEQLTNTSLGEDGCILSPWWSSLKSVLSSSLMPLLRSCTRKRRLSKTGRFLLAKKGTDSLACQWTTNCYTLKCARNCWFSGSGIRTHTHRALTLFSSLQSPLDQVPFLPLWFGLNPANTILGATKEGGEKRLGSFTPIMSHVGSMFLTLWYC